MYAKFSNITSILGILLFILKIMGFISASWLFVLIPSIVCTICSLHALSKDRFYKDDGFWLWVICISPLALKFIGDSDWPWLWAFSPMWIMGSIEIITFLATPSMGETDATILGTIIFVIGAFVVYWGHY